MPPEVGARFMPEPDTREPTTMGHSRRIAALGFALALAAAVGLASDARAATTDVTWNGADGTLVGNGASSNSTTISRIGLTVNARSILLVTTTSGSLPSGHYGIAGDFGGLNSGTVTFTMEIQSSSTWTPVWFATVSTPAGNVLQYFPLSNLGPISFGFAPGTVTGQRLTSTAQPTALGGWGALRSSSSGGTNPNGNTIFRFDTSANPEPATLLLVGAGIGGLAWRRRRRRTQSAA